MSWLITVECGLGKVSPQCHNIGNGYAVECMITYLYLLACMNFVNNEC